MFSALLRTWGNNRSLLCLPLTILSIIDDIWYTSMEIRSDQMSEAAFVKEHPAQDIAVVKTDAPADAETVVPAGKEKVGAPSKKKKSFMQSLMNFVYNPQQKTVLGRSSLNWAKLATFYSIFFFCVGGFFVGLLYLFAFFTDAVEPRYFNEDSTMAVRTTATVVGMGFRPQPRLDDNLIHVSADKDQQESVATSLRLYRQVYLTQKHDAKTEVCSENNPASELPPDVACEFDWSDIVKSDSHPCSEKNLFGFQQQQPCVLVKLNKVYGWIPSNGRLPDHIQNLRGIRNDRPVRNSDVYITCEGTNPADNDVLSDLTYYSMGNPMGSSTYGTIPNYFFPYRNAKDHVQPFVLVQFKKLPVDRLVSVTCRAWAPRMRQDAKANRGLINFQLYRSPSDTRIHNHDDH